MSIRFSLSVENEQAGAGRDGRTRVASINYQARERGRQGNIREISIFPVQLTTGRISNFTRLIYIYVARVWINWVRLPVLHVVS